MLSPCGFIEIHGMLANLGYFFSKKRGGAVAVPVVYLLCLAEFACVRGGVRQVLKSTQIGVVHLRTHFVS